VVTHRAFDLALACVESLTDSIEREGRVVVINLPELCPPETLEKLRSLATVVANEIPCGYGENLNRGLSQLPARFDVVLFLNDDLVFTAGAVENMVEVFSMRPKAAVVGPRIVDRNHDAQPSAFRFNSIGSELLALVMLPHRVARALGQWSGAKAVGPGIHQVDFVLGAAVAARRSAVDEVGGFDTEYFLYFEENDFCQRLRYQGWETYTCGEATVLHYGSASVGADLTFSRIWGKSRHRYLSRHWRWRRRAILYGLQVPVFLWNEAYVWLRSQFDRSQRAGKLLWLAGRYGTANMPRLSVWTERRIKRFRST
jgi:GT2 family glycosyltransferase